ncbi:spore coat protein S [Striga asiatica]|uniref:Spore coat protein S n=1 Tax=Striga asiatica TaxID=4170 RepID=A0A5A7PDS8_STRAF|nr:spore coat protein S [Striga asiatica]
MGGQKEKKNTVKIPLVIELHRSGRQHKERISFNNVNGQDINARPIVTLNPIYTAISWNRYKCERRESKPLRNIPIIIWQIKKLQRKGIIQIPSLISTSNKKNTIKITDKDINARPIAIPNPIYTAIRRSRSANFFHVPSRNMNGLNQSPCAIYQSSYGRSRNFK